MMRNITLILLVLACAAPAVGQQSQEITLDGRRYRFEWRLVPIVAAPAAPTALTATLAQEQVRLAWQDNATDETGYAIHRKDVAGQWVLIASTSAGVAIYTDTEAQQGASYTYRVRAVNAYDASDWSNEVTAGPVAIAPAEHPIVASYEAPQGWTISRPLLVHGQAFGERGVRSVLAYNALPIPILEWRPERVTGLMEWNLTQRGWVTVQRTDGTWYSGLAKRVEENK